MRIEQFNSLTAYAIEQLQRQQQAQPSVQTALQTNADELMAKVAAGNPEDAHKAVIAMEHALMSLDFTLQIRNKVLDAYQEIMKTQV